MTKKTTVLIWLAVVLSTPLVAQFSKGTIMIGGSVSGSFNTFKQKNGSTTNTLYTDNSLTFSPRGGYFLMKNFVAGLEVDVTTETMAYKQSSDRYNYTNLGIGPFARYYFHNVFAHGEVQAGRSTYQDVGVHGPLETTHSSFWVLGIGYALLLNKHLALEPLVSYGSAMSKYSNTSYNTPGINFQIGLQAYLNRK